MAFELRDCEAPKRFDFANNALMAPDTLGRPTVTPARRHLTMGQLSHKLPEVTGHSVSSPNMHQDVLLSGSYVNARAGLAEGRCRGRVAGLGASDRGSDSHTQLFRQLQGPHTGPDRRRTLRGQGPGPRHEVSTAGGVVQTQLPMDLTRPQAEACSVTSRITGHLTARRGKEGSDPFSCFSPHFSAVFSPLLFLV